MRRKINCIWLLLVVVLLITGCMKPVDQLYRLPKRSDEFTELQVAIDEAMIDLGYCAPRSGENQQAVQMADLNGDGQEEYLVYANNDSQSLLCVLIFKQCQDGYELSNQLQCNGTSFDTVEYANLDDKPGFEIILGSQLSEKLQRNADIYSFSADLQPVLLTSVHYTEFLALDMNEDQKSELFVLKSATDGANPGVVELYQLNSGMLECSNSVRLSTPIANLKRVISGKIHGGTQAVFAASTFDESSIITDVFILKGNKLYNITLSGESETSIRTLRSHYVYAEDIDGDDVIELPYLLPMMPMDNMVSGGRQELIRWYAVKANGEEVIKSYTFHNFTDGWYLELMEEWAQRLTVVAEDSAYAFYIWDENFESAKKVLMICTYTGSDESEDQLDSTEFVLYENSGLRLTANLEANAKGYGLDQTSVKEYFHMIHQNWKTGET